MTINITVSDFRGCREAKIECAQIALIGGDNEAGKSSIAQAVAAALTGQAIADRFNIARKDIKLLIRRGASTGKVTLRGAEGTAEISYPDGKLVTTGTHPPQASAVAAGLTSLLDLTKKEDRATMLAPYLKAEPNRDDINRELSEDFDDDSIASIWKKITEDGWDQTHRGWTTARTKASGAWEEITGENFGSAKAQNWRPEGFDEMLLDISKEQHKTNLAEERQSLETALANHAVDESELTRLRALVEALPARQKADADAKTGLATAVAREVKARAHREACLPPSTGGGTPCPHCGKPFIVVTKGPATTYEKFEALPDVENKRRQMAIATHAGDLSNAEAQLNQAKSIAANAAASLAEAERARDTIANAGTNSGSAAQVQAARGRVVVMEQDLAAFTKVTKATGAYERWADADRIAKMLAPDGLRAKKLTEALETWNLFLSQICQQAEWPIVYLNDDFSGVYHETPYSLGADSGRMRARIVLQMAMARTDGSDMMVIDGADMLNLDGRQSLIEVLYAMDIPTVVCMTLANASRVPDLTAAEMGRSYWIEAGRARPVPDQQAA